MFGVSWVEGLIFLCLLAAAVFLIRRLLRRLLKPWRRSSDEPDATPDKPADSRDWTTDVLDEARGTQPRDQDRD
ncbi:hypothetical protein ACQHIV_37800 [Kribbella sp. GL6]|uniref:hypothetical protein n=1 Tax=Kribbella sp. GL6 TaxID=3419765 RepID=UPI003D037E62